jgi:hypothetical protein
MTETYETTVRWEETDGHAVCIGEAKGPGGETVSTVRVSIDHPLSEVQDEEQEELREHTEDFAKSSVREWGVRALLKRFVGARARITWTGPGGRYTMSGSLDHQPETGYVLDSEEGGKHRFRADQVEDIEQPDPPALDADEEGEGLSASL